MEALIIRNSRKKAARLYTTWPPQPVEKVCLLADIFL